MPKRKCCCEIGCKHECHQRQIVELVESIQSLCAKYGHDWQISYPWGATTAGTSYICSRCGMSKYEQPWWNSTSTAGTAGNDLKITTWY